MEPGEAQMGNVGLRFAGLWIRGFALLVDWMIFCAVFFPITRIVKGVWLMQVSDHRWAHGHFVFDPLCLYFLLVIIAYFVLLEGLFGATLGKMIVRIRVVGIEGEPIGMAKSIVRNALRLVDGLPALNLVALCSSSRHRVRHDLVTAWRGQGSFEFAVLARAPDKASP